MPECPTHGRYECPECDQYAARLRDKAAALIAQRDRYEAALRQAIARLRFVASGEGGNTRRILTEAADEAEAVLREALVAAQPNGATALIEQCADCGHDYGHHSSRSNRCCTCPCPAFRTV